MKKLLILGLVGVLTFSCGSSKPSWEYKKTPDSLFEATNIKDNPKVTKFDKGLMKFLSMGTVIWVLHVLTTR